MIRFLCILLAVAVFGSACGKSRKTVIVGSKNGTEQSVLGEIVAQHLERRLDAKV